MSDTVYNVRTVYEVDDRGAGARVGGLGRAFSGLWNTIRSVTGSLFSLRTVLGGAFGAAGVFSAARAITRLGGEAESTRIAIAGMLQAGGASSSIDRAMQTSSDLIEQMRVQARALPGEFQDVLNVFRGGLGGGLAAGQTADHIRQVAGQLMAVTQVLGVDSEQAGRDFALMLEGRAGAQVATFSRLRAQIGMTAEAFNALAPAERFQRIEQAMRGFGPAIDRYQSSWAAVSSTTRDHLTTLLRTSTQPLFERLRDTLARVNEWFERNQTRVLAFASSIGTHLASAFDRIVGLAQRLGEFLSRLSFDRLRSSLTQLGPGLLALRGVAALGLGAAGGAIALPVIAALTSGGPAVGEALRAIGEASRPLVTMLGQLFTATMPLVTMLGVTLIGAITPVIEILGGLGSALQAFGAWVRALPGMEGFLANIRAGIQEFNTGAGRSDVANMAAGVERQREHVANVGRVQDMLRGVRESMPFVGRALSEDNRTRLANVLELSSGQIAGNEALRGRVSALAAVMSMARGRAGVRGGVESMAGLLNTAVGQLPSRVFSGADINISGDRTQPTPNVVAGRGNVHVSVRVEQTIENANDPDRVLIATRQGVLDALMHPLESAGLLVGSDLR
jgi:hypothetical protein